MPRYVLFRDYAPTLTRTDIDAMVLASGAALESYIYRGEAQPASAPHGISWVRSYWQPGGTWGMCVFDAPSLPVLALFQELCSAPFTDAMEVDESAAASGAPTPVAVTVTLTGDRPVLDEVVGATGLESRDVGRMYSNRERQKAVALVQRRPATDGSEAALGVVELGPDEYA